MAASRLPPHSGRGAWRFGVGLSFSSFTMKELFKDKRVGMTVPAIPEEPPDLSLVLGGPLYQLFKRAHLSGHALELLRRRILVLSGIAWVPLLLLSALAGPPLGSAIAIPFLYDIEVHVRFLVALPILIAAELVVHRRLRPVVAQFLERRIVVPEDLARFREAVTSTLRLRNSVVVEVALLVFVYTGGLWIWRNQIALGAASWYAIPDSAGMHLTPAGLWYVFVSVPIFQFILLRWYFRFFLWYGFLWRVSRLNLRLVALHPDRAAGLGFLGKSAYAFAPILFAQGALLAALIASQILYAGHKLMDFKVIVASFLVFFVAMVLSPLAMFTPKLDFSKRQGLRQYGRLASRYVGEFEEKWVRDGAPGEDQLLGSADVQSLADLGNSFAVVQEMRIVPFGMTDVTRLAAGAAAPLLPLLLTIFSLDELVTRVVQVLF
jgi:hypothetical protein